MVLCGSKVNAPSRKLFHLHPQNDVLSCTINEAYNYAGHSTFERLMNERPHTIDSADSTLLRPNDILLTGKISSGVNKEDVVTYLTDRYVSQESLGFIFLYLSCAYVMNTHNMS